MPHTYKKYKNELCNNKMTFQECELAILRHAVDETEALKGEEVAKSPAVIEIIQILESFLSRKKLICYGGTAINNILPKYAQFYNRNVEIPDYDFFSPHALKDAKELADIYAKKGYEEVEAKAGMHPGTFKVFVNFLPIADITYMHPILFKSLEKESITIDGIRYSPPNYLRMSMFLELSRPHGDISRWEKVLKRMNLLNTHYPLKTDKPCSQIDFQRKLDNPKNVSISDQIYYITRDALVDHGVIFLGGYGASLYSKYMPNKSHQINKNPDFDIVAEDPEKIGRIIRERLLEKNISNVKLVKHTAIGEVIPESIEIIVNKDTIAFLYKPLACHGYNMIHVDGKEINIATIDTMLSFYLAFMYADKPYMDKDRILCMSTFLFQVEQKNRLEQKGLLKRFNTPCYGKQMTLEEIRAEKAEMFNKLKNKRGTEEYDFWFLKYVPVRPKEKMAVGKETNESKKKTQKTHEIKIDSLSKTKSELESEQRTKSKKTKKRRTAKKRKAEDIYAKRTFRF